MTTDPEKEREKCRLCLGIGKSGISGARCPACDGSGMARWADARAALAAPAAPQKQPREAFKDLVVTLLNHIADVVSDEDWERIDEKLWNQVSRESSTTAPQEDVYGIACRLATALWEKHYKTSSPNWKPLGSVAGILTQIDNMTSGLSRYGAAPQVGKNAKPVGWRYRYTGDLAPKGWFLTDVNPRKIMGVESFPLYLTNQVVPPNCIVLPIVIAEKALEYIDSFFIEGGCSGGPGTEVYDNIAKRIKQARESQS